MFIERLERLNNLLLFYLIYILRQDIVKYYLPMIEKT